MIFDFNPFQYVVSRFCFMRCETSWGSPKHMVQLDVDLFDGSSGPFFRINRILVTFFDQGKQKIKLKINQDLHSTDLSISLLFVFYEI